MTLSSQDSCMMTQGDSATFLCKGMAVGKQGPLL